MVMRQPSPVGVAALTLSAALGGGLLCQAADLPLPFILGPLVASAIVANLVAPMRHGKQVRRGGQLFIGAAAGAVLGPEGVAEIARLLPVMLGIAVASIGFGCLLAVPTARIAGIDRLSALLSCLPAGMAEMATLARDLGGNEQAVAIIHTLRVMMVLVLIPLWLGLDASASPPVAAAPGQPGDLAMVLGIVAVSGVLGWGASRLRVTNPWIIVPMLVSIGLVGAGLRVPPVPSLLLVAAQIGIGTSLGLRFRLDQIRQFPRIAAAGLLSGMLLILAGFFILTRVAEALTGIDHASAILAVAPGGLGEMIAAASTLGLLAASVAGFQISRSLVTNLLVPPLIRTFMARR